MSRPGELVLDFFAGSGTTGGAAEARLRVPLGRQLARGVPLADSTLSVVEVVLP